MKTMNEQQIAVLSNNVPFFFFKQKSRSQTHRKCQRLQDLQHHIMKILSRSLGIKGYFQETDYIVTQIVSI